MGAIVDRPREMVNVDQINLTGDTRVVASPPTTVPPSGWMTSTEACARLGIRPQSLYAYVSRGLLTPVRQHRRSWYDPAAVEALAQRTARGRRPGRFEIAIDTELTLLEKEGRLSYRGVDLADIVGEWSFERTAAWLWHGIDHGEPRAPWPVPDWGGSRATGGRSAAGGPGDRDVALGVRLRMAVAGWGERPLVEVEGPELIAAMVDALPVASDGRHRRPTRPDGGPIAARLWPRLTARPPTEAHLRALDACLVALADHELATSTLAARVAASTGASLDAVVLAALATLSGPLHGGASENVRLLLDTVQDRGARASVGELRADRQRVPGLGHSVYERIDPRAELLLPIIAAAIDPATAAALTDLRVEVRRRRLPLENVDLALGALLHGTDMVLGAGEAIFAVARTAGWIAHAREERSHRLRYRARAVYTGPRPD